MAINEQKIKLLIERAKGIEESAKSFFKVVQVTYIPLNNSFEYYISEYDWKEPVGDILKKQRSVIELYESWYTISSSIIHKVIPDRKADFVDNYERNKDILDLNTEIYNRKTEKFLNEFLINLTKQVSLLTSTLDLLDELSEGKRVTKTLTASGSSGGGGGGGGFRDYNFLDLKTEVKVLNHRFSRFESDIKDLSQKLDNIGRITLNVINQAHAKVGDINFKNEFLIQGMKPELDVELKSLGEENQKKSTEHKDMINDLIVEVIKEKNPKFDWLKEKLDKINYYASKAGIMISGLSKFLKILGVD